MKAVLLLHGFATDQNDFAPLVTYLKTRYDEVVCPNLPAHGFLQKKQHLDHKKIIAFCEQSFDELYSRHKFVDIIGFSMGGTLATYLAGCRQVNRIVLLAPANKFLAPLFVFKTIGCFWGQGRERKKIKKGKVLKSKYNVDSKELRSDIKIALKLFFGTIIKRYTPKNLSQFFKVIKFCNKNLKQISCPTLILWGKLDQFVKKGTVKHVSAYCDKAMLKSIIYPDVSHTMLYSNASYKIIDDILLFLENTDPLALPYKQK